MTEKKYYYLKVLKQKYPISEDSIEFSDLLKNKFKDFEGDKFKLALGDDMLQGFLNVYSFLLIKGKQCCFVISKNKDEFLSTIFVMDYLLVGGMKKMVLNEFKPIIKHIEGRESKYDKVIFNKNVIPEDYLIMYKKFPWLRNVLAERAFYYKEFKSDQTLQLLDYIGSGDKHGYIFLNLNRIYLKVVKMVKKLSFDIPEDFDTKGLFIKGMVKTLINSESKTSFVVIMGKALYFDQNSPYDSYLPFVYLGNNQFVTFISPFLENENNSVFFYETSDGNIAVSSNSGKDHDTYLTRDYKTRNVYKNIIPSIIYNTNYKAYSTSTLKKDKQQYVEDKITGARIYYDNVIVVPINLDDLINRRRYFIDIDQYI